MSRDIASPSFKKFLTTAQPNELFGVKKIKEETKSAKKRQQSNIKNMIDALAANPTGN